MGNGWYGMGFGGPLMWIIWILLAVFIFWVLKSLFGGSDGRTGGSPPGTPLEILKQRFARGEIDEEEFRRRRQVLEDSSNP
ncbi:MAG TPA: SHOCT domain-containing protein [Sedimenticola sp.]|nr:SHOCT domain-containing protein [Sedimenticola sp.]